MTTKPDMVRARAGGRAPEPGRPRATPGPAESAEHAHRREEVEHRREEIERYSPEGSPGDPEYGARDIGWILVAAAVGVIVLSIVVGAFAGVAAGAVVLVFGLGLALLFNPEIWAASVRAEERYEIDHKGDAEGDGSDPRSPDDHL